MNGVVDDLRRQANAHFERAARMWFQAFYASDTRVNDTTGLFFVLSLNRRAIEEYTKALNAFNFLDRLEL